MFLFIDVPVLKELILAMTKKLSNFRNVIGEKINLFSDENKNYIEVPKLKIEENSSKRIQDLKTPLKQKQLIKSNDQTSFISLNDLIE